MRRLRPMLGLLVVLALAGGASAGDEPAATALALEGPEGITGLLLEDVTGDGVTDVVLGAGRTLWIYASRKGGLPAPEPTRRLTLPEDASHVDAATARTMLGPGLVVLGPAGLRHVDVATGALRTVDAGGPPPPWQDSDTAAFIDFVRDDGTILIPTDGGWRVLEPREGGMDVRELDAPPERHLEPAGAFLEDTARVVVAHPHLFRGARFPGGGDAERLPWWTLSGPEVLVFHGEQRVALPVPRRTRTGQRSLVDLDADGTPDLCQQRQTNRKGSYAFYRTRSPVVEEGTLRARDFVDPQPTTRLDLDGFQLEPRHVDLDGDGLLDFVVTTIPVDARNTVKALTGQVTAYTHAFLQRESGELYSLSPDRSVASNIGIAVRLSKRGRIDVRRSFTILVDADLDGDGRKDLVIRTREAELTVYRGSPAGVWSEEGQVLPIPPQAGSPNIEGFRADLDGNGRDEILLLYRGAPGGRDVLRMVSSR